MFKNLVIVTLTALLITSCSGVSRQNIMERFQSPSASFVPSLPDVPLPAKFVADTETATFFDSAEGRIAEVTAEGFADTPQEIESFYDETMPQFGWKKVSALVYSKEGELLVITPTKGQKLVTLKFQLRPAL